MDNDAVIADILATLFRRLDEADVKYCVLRDYEGLAETYRNDVDFLVNPADRLMFQDILVDVAADGGWLLAKHVRKYALWFYYFYPAHSDGGGRFILHVDLFYTIAWKGITYLVSEDVLRERIRYDGFFVPRLGHEAAILLLKDLLHVGSVRVRYRGKIQSLVEQDIETLHACLQSSLGQGLSDFLVEGAIQGWWDEIESRRRAIQWAMAWRAFTRAPLVQMAKGLRFVWGHLRQPIMNPAGLFIVVLGSDGSGKTTVIHELMPLLEKLFARSRRLSFNFGMVPHIWGDLRDWIRTKRRGGHAAVGEMVGEGPRLTPFPTFRALAHLVYHTVGFLLGYPLLFVTRRRGELLIVERYLYDYFVQPSYAHIPRWLLRAMLRLLPKPDAVIYLHGDPRLIHDRKPELPVNEIERQEGILRDLLLQMSNGYMFDVSAPASAVARQAGRVICQIMERRDDAHSASTISDCP